MIEPARLPANKTLFPTVVMVWEVNYVPESRPAPGFMEFSPGIQSRLGLGLAGRTLPARTDLWYMNITQRLCGRRKCSGKCMRITNNVTIHSLVEYRALPKFKLQESTEYNDTKYMYSVGIPDNLLIEFSDQVTIHQKLFILCHVDLLKILLSRRPGSSIIK